MLTDEAFQPSKPWMILTIPLPQGSLEVIGDNGYLRIVVNDLIQELYDAIDLINQNEPELINR